MERAPAVTVIVPTYNREEYLAECLESLLEQTRPAHQIIVAVDGSTDGTADLLRHFQGRVEVLHTSHGGKSETLNRAMEHVTGEYVWIFDDDDVAMPDALERFVTPLERHPEHDFSYSSCLYMENAPGSRHMGRVTGESVIPDLEPRGFLVHLLEADFVGGAALFVRTRCYDEVGPFDPRLLRSQDYEMAVRIARRHTGIRVEGGATYYHRHHPGLRGPRDDRFDPSLRNQKWLEHDQLFFRELYGEIPLQEYLPPDTPLASNQRRAVLQRMAVMASKLLHREATEDVHVLAGLAEAGPFTEAEEAIIAGALTGVPYYGTEWILDDPGFTGALTELSERSENVRALAEAIDEAKTGSAGQAKVLREHVERFFREQTGRRAGKDRQQATRDA